jgi:ABC-2 type transport system ATP-binding protein
MTLPLQTTALTKKIGKRTIVDRVELAVEEGEVFGFLGPNGAGKTTTIRMLVGLIRPTAGEISICGHSLGRNFEKAMRCIGCIVETPDLYRFLSGRENLEHFARMIGSVPQSEIESVARTVGLEHRLDDRVRTYSLGMRQRLGIAQALLGKPRLLILDEPANGLDPAGIHELRQLLRSLAHEQGISIFLSSHLLAEIELTCDRVAMIHRGRLIASGPVDELLEATSYILIRAEPSAQAALIAGKHGTVTEHEGMLRLNSEVDVPALVSALVSEGVAVQEVRLARPTLEDIFLDRTGGQSVGD